MIRLVLSSLLLLSCTDKHETPVAPVPDEPSERPGNRTCVAPGGPPRLAAAFPELPRLDSAIQLVQAPGAPDWWYVAEQGGRIYRFANDPSANELIEVGSIADRVSSGYELGLLGMAFHPDFQSNGEVILSYTRPNNDSRIVRVRATDGGARFEIAASMEAEDLILTIAQPFGNHNGGHVAFGPDGYLYFGSGDGGSAGDPLGHGQDTSSLLGAMLRLDIDGGAPYAIPSDNPFADGGGAPEIYAWGLRNPWRFSFDRETGELWAGDVGQNAWEEIDRIERGKNYGWNTMEGFECYGSTSCDETGLALPVVTYGHNLGYSVTGGFVYRGSRVRSLLGRYVFADFGTGRIWGVFDGEEGPERRLLINSNTNPSTFAEDLDGELYVVDYYGGQIYAFDVDEEGAVEDVPATLSATGCVDANDPTTFVEGVVPYTLNVPFWSDGLDKKRYFAIPDGTTVDADEVGDLHFPPGTVLIKEFFHGTDRVETRLFFHHEQDQWSGYSYVWNEEGTDAVLAAERQVAELGDLSWTIPSPTDCMTCHTAAAGRSLGLELPQLEQGDQLQQLADAGYFTEPLPAVTPYAADDARAYLHSNCSHCHRPDAAGGGDVDLRFSTSLDEMNACNVTPQFGDLEIAGITLLTPGDPTNSMIAERMRRTDGRRMPLLGTTVVDEAGLGLVERWITEITTCDAR